MRKIDIETVKFVVGYIATEAPSLNPIADEKTWNDLAYQALDALAEERGEAFSENESDDVVGYVYDTLFLSDKVDYKNK